MIFVNIYYLNYENCSNSRGYRSYKWRFSYSRTIWIISNVSSSRGRWCSRSRKGIDNGRSQRLNTSKSNYRSNSRSRTINDLLE